MTPDGRLKLKTLLVQHESYRQFVYTDKTGHLTVGIGRNLTDRGLSLKEALYLLDQDTEYFYLKLAQIIPFWDELIEARQIVLVDMCFNLGVNGLLGFKDMFNALAKKDYPTASKEIINSKAAIQCPDRYHSLAKIMLTGEI